MTDTMIERVARAICAKNCQDPDEPDYAFLSDRATGYAWQGFIPHARAAIDAMREPTEEMVAAGCAEAAKEQVRPVAVRRGDVVLIYRALIGTALTEKPDV